MNPIEHNLLMEAHRREKPGDVRTSPASETLDYATAGIKIQCAMHHLDEALPGRQVERARAALAALEEGTREMRDWMKAQGWLGPVVEVSYKWVVMGNRQFYAHPIRVVKLLGDAQIYHLKGQAEAQARILSRNYGQEWRAVRVMVTDKEVTLV